MCAKYFSIRKNPPLRNSWKLNEPHLIKGSKTDDPPPVCSSPTPSTFWPVPKGGEDQKTSQQFWNINWPIKNERKHQSVWFQFPCYSCTSKLSLKSRHFCLLCRIVSYYLPGKIISLWLLVPFGAVIRVVTQHFLPGCCVTTPITTAKEAMIGWGQIILSVNKTWNNYYMKSWAITLQEFTLHVFFQFRIHLT